MPFEIMMPRLGWDMERGILGQWLKPDGAPVEAGEPLFTVEGDKASQEVEALDSGILHIPPGAPEPGTEVVVGTLLGYILAAGEPAPQSTSAEYPRPTRDAAPAPAVASREHDAPPATVARAGRRPAISPRARRVAAECQVDWRALQGSGRGGRIIERDVRAATASTAVRPRISPLARALAADHGLDVDVLAASLPAQRIEVAHVERALADRLVARPATPTPASPALPGRRFALSQIRQTIANRMSASAHTAAPVTLTTEADVSQLVQLREQLRAAGENPLPSYTDFLIKLVSYVLESHPALNARFDGDAIIQHDVVNMGIAVDTERGLLVPVVRDIGRMSVREIAVATAGLIARARQGTIQREELEGGTFTLTNLGMYDIDAFTPIINLPECAVLGIGRIVPKPVVVNPLTDEVAVRRMMALSLTFDHRLTDGAPAARFLQSIKRLLEHLGLWLVRMR